MLPERVCARVRIALQSVKPTGARGQTRTIGLLFLTVMAIALTVSLVAFSFALTSSESDDVAMASIGLEISEDEVTVIHNGGDSLESNEVTLDINGGQRSISLSAFSSSPSHLDQLTAGDRWSHNIALTDDQVLVTVVHEPTGTVLAESRRSF